MTTEPDLSVPTAEPLPPAARYPRGSVRRWFARRPWRRRAVRTLVVVVLALAGAVGGLLLGGHVQHRVGPVDATFRLGLAWHGQTEVQVPPLGALRIADHGGPLQLQATVTEVRMDAVRRLAAAYPQSINDLGSRVSQDVRAAIISLALHAGIAALLGAVLLTGLVVRRVRAALAALAVAVAAVIGSGGAVAATFDPEAIAEPTFTGLLASAPAAFGDVRDIQARFTAYRGEIARLVANVSKLYGVAATLPMPPADGDTIRLLWVSDIHDNPEAFNVIRTVARQFDVEAVLDTGDMSDHGTTIENPLYEPIADLGLPYVFVKGNHDSAVTVDALRAIPNVVVLDDQIRKVAGVEIAGIGDPLFTPDKTTELSPAASQTALDGSGRALAALLDGSPVKADLAMLHDPAAAGPVFGHVPLLLAGHLHHREHEYLNGTLLLVQGSTGGAGLRGLESTQPTPLELSVLYLSRSSHRLVAYDDITVGGLGTTSAQIERHAAASVIADAPKPAPQPSATPSASASAGPSASASASPSAGPSASASGSPSAGPSASGSASVAASAGSVPHPRKASPYPQPAATRP